MGYFGQLINSAVRATGGGLRGQNEGDKELYDQRREAARDEREQKRLELEDSLRRFAAERQARADESLDTERRRTAAHYTYEEQPTWKKEGYPSLEAYDRAKDHTDDRPEWQRKGYSSFEAWRRDETTAKRSAPGEASGDTRQALTSVERQVDDTRSDLSRAERDVPPALDQLPIQPEDTAAYNRIRQPAVDRVDNLRHRADSLGGVRDSIAGAFMRGSRPSGGSSPATRLPITAGGPPPDRPLGHAASRKPIPGTQPAAAPATTPIASDVTAGDTSLQLQDLERQKAEALAWRGPNGERKDPQAIERRYEEARSQLAGGQ